MLEARAAAAAAIRGVKVKAPSGGVEHAVQPTNPPTPSATWPTAPTNPDELLVWCALPRCAPYTT